MIQKQKAEIMITAEEVVEIFRRAGTVESLQRARDIEQAYTKLNNIENEPDLTWYKYGLLAAVYDGGRIQGIREERAKQHNNSNNIQSA